MTTVTKVRHPAKFTNSIVDKILDRLGMSQGLALDPFAGTGWALPHFATPTRYMIGIELEKPYVDAFKARNHQDCELVHWDSTKLTDLYDPDTFDFIISSPAYGNRLADAFNAQDGSTRHSYTFDLRDSLKDDTYTLNQNNTGLYKFGSVEYKILHEKVWKAVTDVSKPGAIFFLNASDFLKTVTRNKEKKRIQVPVTSWHIRTLEDLGWSWTGAQIIKTPRLRHGQNYEARVEGEWLIEMRLTA